MGSTARGFTTNWSLLDHVESLHSKTTLLHRSGQLCLALSPGLITQVANIFPTPRVTAQSRACSESQSNSEAFISRQFFHYLPPNTTMCCKMLYFCNTKLLQSRLFWRAQHSLAEQRGIDGACACGTRMLGLGRPRAQAPKRCNFKRRDRTN